MDVLNFKNIINFGCDLNFNLPFKVENNSVLEIGFGNGEFTVKYARSHPEIFLYAVEISKACVIRCVKRAKDLSNLKIIRTDARYMLKELFPDESLNKIIMNFPCPWPGNKHAHRRVTAKDFADGLASVLKINSEFQFTSDDENYSNEVWKILGAHEALNPEKFEINSEIAYLTKYGRKWLNEGKNIYSLTFRKIKKFSVERQIINNSQMHIKLNINKYINKNLINNLNNISGHDVKNKSFWKFGKCFNDDENKIFLLETFTSDDEFEQRFYINISNREDNTALIKLDFTADTFLTPAVRNALNDVAEKLKLNLNSSC